MSTGDPTYGPSKLMSIINPYVCPKCDGMKHLPLSSHAPCPTCCGTGVVFGPSSFSAYNVLGNTPITEDVYTITKEELATLLDSIKDYHDWTNIVRFFDPTLTIPERFVVPARPDPDVKTRNHNCWDCNSKDCFNKRFVPKESSEGRDCKDWE